MTMTHADRFRWEQDVLANANLTPTQKNILTRLALHLNIKTGRCDPSVKTLAKGAGAAERTVQTALSRAERLGIIERSLGGGRALTTSYTLLLSSETVHSAAPFSETVHGETLFQMETVHSNVEKDARNGGKPCTAVHPNIENKGNTVERLKEEFDQWYSIYPRHVAGRAAFKAYRQARSRGATAETLRTGAKRYAAQRAGQDQQFTKYPATWLSGDCWMDEPESTSRIDVPAYGNAGEETLSMAERMAAAAKWARAQ